MVGDESGAHRWLFCKVGNSTLADCCCRCSIFWHEESETENESRGLVFSWRGYRSATMSILELFWGIGLPLKID
jgi:hypothetical protein